MVERKFTRILFKTKAIVETSAGSLDGQIQNLGLGGMYFQAPGIEKVTDGEDVIISMMVEGSSSIVTIRIKGRVMRHQQTGIAIQFNVEQIKLDSLLLLRVVITSNGGDKTKVEKEFRTIMQLQKKNQAKQKQAQD